MGKKNMFKPKTYSVSKSTAMRGTKRDIRHGGEQESHSPGKGLEHLRKAK